jgi:hypothetical protein
MDFRHQTEERKTQEIKQGERSKSGTEREIVPYLKAGARIADMLFLRLFLRLDFIFVF